MGPEVIALALALALAIGGAATGAVEKKPAEGDEAAPASESATLTPPEYVGPATPYEDADVLRQLTRVDELLGRGEPLLAFDMLDKIASSAVEGVASTDGILYLPIRESIIRRFRSLPPEQLELYRRHYDPPARSAVAKAVEALDIEALERLGERYALTASGPDAFESAGDLAWDRGESWRAAASWTRAADLAPVADRRGRLEAKIALALLRDGARDRALARIERLAREAPDLEIPFGGERIPAKALANHAVFGSAPTPPSQTGGWPCAGGGPARGSYAGSTAGTLGWRVSWIATFDMQAGPPGDIVASAVDVASKAEAMGGPYARMVRFPAPMGASDGKLVFHRTKDKVVSRDLRTGKVMRVSTGEISAIVPSPGYPAGSPQQWLMQWFSPNGTLEVTYDGENVYAIEAPANVASPYGRRQTVLPANKLFAFDAGTAKKQWDVELADPKSDGGGIAFLAPPIPTAIGDPRRVLIAAAASREAPELVGLSVGGKVLWHRPLFGFDTTSRTRYGLFYQTAPSVAAGDRVAIALYSCGAAAAVRPRDGALLWVCRYRSRLRDSTFSGQDWRFIPGPPILVQGPTGDLLAIIAANDSDFITALRAETGEIVWERPIASGGWVLLGADRERVYIAGNGAKAFAIADGSPVWSTIEIGPMSGRGFVAEDALLLPLRGGIARLDRETGKVLETITFRDSRFITGSTVWPDRTPILAPGNLIAAGDRLVAFGPWGAAGIEPATGAIEEKDGVNRMRALAAAGRFREALDLGFALLKDPAPRDRSAVRTEIVRTAIEAARRLGDPTFLEGVGDLADSRERRTAIALERAELLARAAPEKAAEILVTAANDWARSTAELTDGRIVAAGPWASAWLRDLIDAGRIQPVAKAESAMAEALAVTPPDERSLGNAFASYPYATRAPEAAARLARLSSDSGKDERAAAYWAAAAAGEALEALAKLLPPDAARILLQEVAQRSGAGDATRAALIEKLLGGIPDPAVSLPEKPVLRFWKKVENGVVARGMGGELPGIVVREGAKLIVFGPDGEARGEIPLRDWPDLSSIPGDTLQYYRDEEILCRFGDTWSLVTSAGVYGLAEEGEGFRSREKWIRSMEHPVLALVRSGMQSYQIQNQIRMGALRGPMVCTTPRGLFVFAGTEGMVIDPANGKIRPGGQVNLKEPGPVIDRASPWLGSLFLVTATRPMRIDLASGKISSLQPWKDGEETERMSPGRPGIALVCETSKRVVARDLIRDREIWSEGGEGLRPWVGWTEPGRTWLVWPTGWVGCVETETGRSLWKTRFDEGYLARTAWRMPGGIILALTRTRPAAKYSGAYPWIADLDLLAVDLDGRVMWRTPLVSGRATFDPEAVLRGAASWWFAYHAAEAGETWRLEIVRIDPKTGSREVILQRPQETKGKDRAPVLVPVRGGVAVGNPDGFGLLADPPDVVK